MVDRLKKSLEELEPPVCEKCDLEMKWYRSEIQVQVPSMVDHHFFCSSCGGKLTRSTALRSGSFGEKPGHHSLPFALPIEPNVAENAREAA